MDQWFHGRSSNLNGMQNHIRRNLPKFKGSRYLSFPMIVADSHWLLSVADLREAKLYMLDSFGLIKEEHSGQVCHIAHYVRTVREELVKQGELPEPITVKW
jgi:hypothetical protein